MSSLQVSYLASPLSEAQVRELRDVVTLLREFPPRHAHLERTINALISLIESNLDYFFIRPLTLLHLGYWAQKVTKMGVKTSQRAMALIIQQVVHHLSEAQLEILAEILEEALLTLDHSD